MADQDATDAKRFEARLRRAATSMGLTLRKSRARDTCRMDFGCFRIESSEGRPVAGTYPYPYSLSLEQVAEVLDQLEENPKEMARTADGRPIHGVAGAADPNWGR